jgi:ribosomal protein S18 acetylase RimI-like enzyme
VNVSYRLVPFDAKAPPLARDLARLHAALLPTSSISLLGPHFMERFYYKLLPREGLLFGAVAYIDDQPVGFVAATHDADGFMRIACRRRWPYLVWVVGTSILIAPRSIRAVWQACRVMMSRAPAADARPDGEILSLGVLPAYREPRFIRQSGLRISTDLLDTAVSELCARGVRAIRATVNADNTPAKLFYIGLGWTLGRTNVPGWQAATVEFVQHV